MQENPYDPPRSEELAHSGRSETSRRSWRRRRLAGAGAVVTGGILLIALESLPTPALRFKALLIAPAALLVGFAGLIHPPTLPDPRPIGGAIGAVSEAGSPALVAGGILFFIGLGIGAFLAFRL